MMGLPPGVDETWIGFFARMAEQMRRNQHKGFQDTWFNEPLSKQLSVLHQSVEEVRVALAYGNDVEDKLADVANWACIMYDNYVNNPASHIGGVPGISAVPDAEEADLEPDDEDYEDLASE
jgi:hypothetical protein